MIATNGYLPIILHYCFPVNNKKRIDLSPIPRYNEKCRGDVPKWLKGPHSKCGRSGNRRESSNLSISVTNATEEGCEVYLEKNILRSLFTLQCISIMVRWTDYNDKYKCLGKTSRQPPTTYKNSQHPAWREIHKGRDSILCAVRASFKILCLRRLSRVPVGTRES